MDYHPADTKIHQSIIYSLPDGQTGILLKLLESYMCEEKNLETELYIKKQIKLLTSQIQEVQYSNHPTMSHFPFELNPQTCERQYTNKFSWSCGDLPILVLLYRADKAFNEKENSFIANTVGSIVAKRTQIEPINQNPFIRHGTTGIAQCFYALYQMSNKSFYLEAYHFWITETYRYVALGYSEVLSDNFLDNYDGVNSVLDSYQSDKDMGWTKQILL